MRFQIVSVTGHDHESFRFDKTAFGKAPFDISREAPVVQFDPPGRNVVQFHELADFLRAGGMVHDFVDDDFGTGRRRVGGPGGGSAQRAPVPAAVRVASLGNLSRLPGITDNVDYPAIVAGS